MDFWFHGRGTLPTSFLAARKRCRFDRLSQNCVAPGTPAPLRGPDSGSEPELSSPSSSRALSELCDLYIGKQGVSSKG